MQIVFALVAAATLGTAAHAQDVPQVISPLRVETDHNGVNLVDGGTRFDTPTLAVPGAPNLRFDRVQNAAPYVSGTINSSPEGGSSSGSFSIHTGRGSSESFRCIDFECTSVTGTGSTFNQNARLFRQAGSGALYTFGKKHVDTIGTNPRTMLYYLSNVKYPNGETITYSYDTATLAGDPFNRTFYRPNRIESDMGFFITLSYHGQDFNADPNSWAQVAEAAIYSVTAPLTPIRRLTYSGGGATITDHGSSTGPEGRVFSCTGCTNQLGVDLQVASGTSQLPGESSAALQAVAVPGHQVVGSVTRDGVQWTYSYDNLRLNAYSSGYLYDRLTVDGPNSFHTVYDMIRIEQRNVISRITDSIARATTYEFDDSYRPTRAVYPELNEVSIAYDEYGNIESRTATPKPGSGQSPVTETAYYPTDTCLGVLCYRPTWSRDGLNRQTDYLYNANGQLIEQTDPADGTGVRRKTYIAYETSTGISRRSVVRICGDTTTCGTASEIRTEYEYWGSTLLPSLERQVDGATGQTLVTTYSYDNAGRLLSTDGPLPGSDDATYRRYDVYGRLTWEIGARGSNGLRIAQRHAYRNSDDSRLSTEMGTLPDASSEVLTVFRRTDLQYDSRRHPVHQAVSANGTTSSVLERSFDDQGRLVCEARRMNPSAFGPLRDACTLGPQGTGSNDFGPDRITHNVYDAAGQLLQVQQAYLTADQQDYATYEYTQNGLRRSVTDGNGNRAEMTYDGFDRQRRWIFPSPTTPGVVNAGDYEEYGYDTVGNRTTLRKRDASLLTYQYDNLNRLIVKQVPERAGLSPTHTRDVYYGYDIQGLQLSVRFDSPTGDGVTNAYDGFGRLTSSTLAMDGVSRTLSYQYDAAGNRTRITHPGGTWFSTDYDALGRPFRLSENGTVPRYLFEYYNHGALLRLTRGNVTGTSLAYDDVQQLSVVAHFPNGPSNYSYWNFTHNPVGQIASVTRTNDAYAWTDHYGANRNYTANGLNQYTSAGSASFAYDANGNLISDGATTFTYDVENRLVAANGAHTAALRYDPLGRLYEVGGASGTTRFLYDGDALVAEYNAAGTLTARYVHGSDGAADDPLLWYDGSGAIRYFHADHQGSIVAVTDSSGAVQVNAYDEYGIPAAANQGRFQYTGQAWIPELGMYHYKARVYSPTLGRFLQSDPIGYEDQINLYNYVGNDPINEEDPTGMCPLCVGLGLEVLNQATNSNDRAAWRSAWSALRSGDVGGALRAAGPQAARLAISAATAGVGGKAVAAAERFVPTITGRVVAATGIGAAENAANQAGSNIANGRPTREGVIESAVVGGAGAALGRQAGRHAEDRTFNSGVRRTSSNPTPGSRAEGQANARDAGRAAGQRTATQVTAGAQGANTLRRNLDPEQRH